jgi:oligoendopeptidase F
LPVNQRENPNTKPRREFRDELKWRLDDIYTDWTAWESAYAELERRIGEYAQLKGTLANGPEPLLAAYKLNDELGQLAYKVYFFPSLKYDEDQRDNQVNARRQQVQALMARWQEVTSWLSPELLAIPVATVRGWMATTPALAMYKFAIEEVYRQQEHVLDEKGERLMSLSSRLSGAPNEAYQALSTADAKFPEVALSTGEKITVSYAQYRAVLATNRRQPDRRAAFLGHYGTFEKTSTPTRRSITASASATGSTRARAATKRHSTPPCTATTSRGRGGNADRSHARRCRAAPSIPPAAAPIPEARQVLPVRLFNPNHRVESAVRVRRGPRAHRDVSGAARPGIPGADAPRIPRALDRRLRERRETQRRYSAPVYGVHPYMLMNWADTLDDVFTLAHEMGHSMHTMLSHERQPFVYSDYTIFVAEVPSTLSEALLLDQWLATAADKDEQIVLLQHAIDNITSTFYTQVLFADYELAAHKLVEDDEPITSETLNALYKERFEAYYGDSVDMEPLTPITWARIPHFFNTPFYVYQYATCFASAAKLAGEITYGPEAGRQHHSPAISISSAPAAAITHDFAPLGGRRPRGAFDGQSLSSTTGQTCGKTREPDLFGLT